MRILHIVESLSRCSGITNFVVNYYKCSLSRTDITMDFIYFKEDNNSFKEFLTTTGAKCYHLELPSPTNILKTLKHYSDFFSKYGSEYDIVHLHEVVLSHIILPFAKKHGIRNRIIHAHSTKLSTKSGLGYLRNWFLTRSLNDCANALWGCSVMACQNLFGSKSHFTVIHNAIETSKYQFDNSIRTLMRKKLNIDGKIALVSIGRLSPEKNHIFLINIFNDLLQIKRNVHLLIVGSGELEENLKSHTHNLRIEENVSFLGLRSDIPEILMASDIMLIPSLFEGLSIVTIEAQASGLPSIISTGVPDEAVLIPEYCKRISLSENKKVWIDNILSLCNNQRIISRDIIISKGYDIETEFSKLIHHYQQLIDSTAIQ